MWLWSHQAWTSKTPESLPPLRSSGCHWLVAMCLCPIDCEMVCCYTAVLHLRPTEVIDWFGHVECSHLVCSNVVFFLFFFHLWIASAAWIVTANSFKGEIILSSKNKLGFEGVCFLLALFSWRYSPSVFYPFSLGCYFFYLDLFLPPPPQARLKCTLYISNLCKSKAKSVIFCCLLF